MIGGGDSISKLKSIETAGKPPDTQIEIVFNRITEIHSACSAVADLKGYIIIRMIVIIQIQDGELKVDFIRESQAVIYKYQNKIL